VRRRREISYIYNKKMIIAVKSSIQTSFWILLEDNENVNKDVKRFCGFGGFMGERKFEKRLR
jgi:hypothetical protein